MVMRTQQQRRANGIDVLGTLMGIADGQRAAGSMERRHGDLGSFAVDHVLGDLWSRPQLSRRDRSLIVVSFLATIGAKEELTAHVEGALHHGLTRSEIREVVNQVAGYAGFPMAMQATRIVDAVFASQDGLDRLEPKDPGPSLDDVDRHAAAVDVMATLFDGRVSSDPTEARASVVDALGGVGEMVFDFGFGELWARSELSRRDRSLVTVAILAILRCSEELGVHVPGALNHGCSREEVEEVMVQLTVYGGFPRAVEGMRATRAAFAKIDARTSAGE